MRNKKANLIRRKSIRLLVWMAFFGLSSHALPVARHEPVASKLTPTRVTRILEIAREESRERLGRLGGAQGYNAIQDLDAKVQGRISSKNSDENDTLRTGFLFRVYSDAAEPKALSPAALDRLERWTENADAPLWNWTHSVVVERLLMNTPKQGREKLVAQLTRVRDRLREREQIFSGSGFEGATPQDSGP